MSSVDLDWNATMNDPELQWRRAHEATMTARTHYEEVAGRLRALANVFEKARERLDILEILEARSLAEIQSHRRENEQPAQTG
jgi:hypothetical protein